PDQVETRSHRSLKPARYGCAPPLRTSAVSDVSAGSWFNRPDRVSALQREGDRWLGTPFVPNSAERGPRGGVSCQKLVAELYFAVGFVERLPIPDAAMAHARA